MYFHMFILFLQKMKSSLYFVLQSTMKNKVNLNDVIHEKNRLLILSLMLKEGELSFGDLKEFTGMTDGNLASHLRILEENKIIEVKKSFLRRKPRTTYKLTSLGKEKFINYLETLKKFLNEISEEANNG